MRKVPDKKSLIVVLKELDSFNPGQLARFTQIEGDGNKKKRDVLLEELEGRGLSTRQKEAEKRYDDKN